MLAIAKHARGSKPDLQENVWSVHRFLAAESALIESMAFVMLCSFQWRGNFEFQSRSSWDKPVHFMHNRFLQDYQFKWQEWWGMIGRKGCVNQDGCIMHEGPDDQTTEDGPCLAPSTPLSHALTILGIRHQCAPLRKWKWTVKVIAKVLAHSMSLSWALSPFWKVKFYESCKVKVEAKFWPQVCLCQMHFENKPSV